MVYSQFPKVTTNTGATPKHPIPFSHKTHTPSGVTVEVTDTAGEEGVSEQREDGPGEQEADHHHGREGVRN